MVSDVLCIFRMSSSWTDLERLRLKQANNASKRLGFKNILRRRAFRVLERPLTVFAALKGDQSILKNDYVTLELINDNKTLRWDITLEDFNSLKESNFLSFKSEGELLTSHE